MKFPSVAQVNQSNLFDDFFCTCCSVIVIFETNLCLKSINCFSIPKSEYSHDTRLFCCSSKRKYKSYLISKAYFLRPKKLISTKSTDRVKLLIFTQLLTLDNFFRLKFLIHISSLIKGNTTYSQPWSLKNQSLCLILFNHLVLFP